MLTYHCGACNGSAAYAATWSRGRSMTTSVRTSTAMVTPALDYVWWRRPRAAGVICPPRDRKSTRLNSSHVEISYAVFCLKKKKNSYKPYQNRKENNTEKNTTKNITRT